LKEKISVACGCERAEGGDSFYSGREISEQTLEATARKKKVRTNDGKNDETFKEKEGKDPGRGGKGRTFCPRMK